MTNDEHSEPYGRLRQAEVYTSGMFADQTPEIPIAYEDLKRAAEEALDEAAYAYLAGGAGSEDTQRENRRAFDRWRLLPRMGRDVAERDLSVELFGQRLPVPFLLAPIGVQSILHEDGELATARAAADLDVPFVLSTASSETLEDVAEAGGDANAWFQLYWSADDDLTASLVERAETAGYEALVVTLDTPLLGWRERDVDLAYLPFMDGEGVANYFSDPAFREGLGQSPEENLGLAVNHFLDVFADAGHTWADLADLAATTDLPVLVKGVLHPEDADLAVKHGADGVVVSNHGGRQVDGSVGALTMLPEVVDAVGDDVPVLFDSGIRRGADAVKAVALGADAVLLGRPYACGLAVAGQEGVRAVVENFRADLDLTLALTGHDAVREVGPDALLDGGRD